MDEKFNDTQEKAGIKNLDMPELVQEELQNTQSDEEELNSIAEMIRERLDAKEEINKILTKFKIR